MAFASSPRNVRITSESSPIYVVRQAYNGERTRPNRHRNDPRCHPDSLTSAREPPVWGFAHFCKESSRATGDSLTPVRSPAAAPDVALLCTVIVCWTEYRSYRSPDHGSDAAAEQGAGEG